MKIATSNNYYHGWDCVLDDCERHYCNQHRTLWRDCDTAEKGMDDCYLNGRPHYVWTLGDPPCCIAEYLRKKLDRMVDTQIEDWKEAKHAEREAGFVPILVLVIIAVAVASFVAVRHEQKVNDKAQTFQWPSMSVPNYDGGGR